MKDKLLTASIALTAILIVSSVSTGVGPGIRPGDTPLVGRFQVSGEWWIDTVTGQVRPVRDVYKSQTWRMPKLDPPREPPKDDLSDEAKGALRDAVKRAAEEAPVE